MISDKATNERMDKRRTCRDLIRLDKVYVDPVEPDETDVIYLDIALARRPRWWVRVHAGAWVDMETYLQVWPEREAEAAKIIRQRLV